MCARFNRAFTRKNHFTHVKATIPKIGINTRIWYIPIFTNHILWLMIRLRVSYLRKISGVNLARIRPFHQGLSPHLDL